MSPIVFFLLLALATHRVNCAPAVSPADALYRVAYDDMLKRDASDQRWQEQQSLGSMINGANAADRMAILAGLVTGEGNPLQVI